MESVEYKGTAETRNSSLATDLLLAGQAEDAFVELNRSPALYQYAEKLFKSAPLRGLSPEDVVQEALVRVWARRQHFEFRGIPLEGMIFVVIANLMRDYGKSSYSRNTEKLPAA